MSRVRKRDASLSSPTNQRRRKIVTVIHLPTLGQVVGVLPQGAEVSLDFSTSRPQPGVDSASSCTQVRVGNHPFRAQVCESVGSLVLARASTNKTKQEEQSEDKQTDGRKSKKDKRVVGDEGENGVVLLVGKQIVGLQSNSAVRLASLPPPPPAIDSIV